MYTNKFIENARELASLTNIRMDLKRSMLTAEKDLATIELSITPADGWPGKNEAERKVNQARLLWANERWQWAENGRASLQSELLRVESYIEATTFEQDALKWSIRNETNITLGGRDWLNAQMDEQQDEAQAEPEEESEPVFEIDDPHDLSGEDELTGEALVEKLSDLHKSIVELAEQEPK